MLQRRADHLFTLLTVGLLTVSVVVSAQTQARSEDPAEPPAPPSQVFSDGELDQLYRDLYGVQVRLGRGTSSDLDSMRAVRDSLLAEIRRIGEQLEAHQDLADPRGPADVEWDQTFDTFVEDIEDAAVDSDWERLADVLDKNAEVWGQGLAVLGQELKGMQVEIDEDRVRIDTGSGSRLTFKIPDEVKEEMRRGIREMGVELNRVLEDSSGGSWGAEIDGLLDELPEDLGSFFGRRRASEKTIIAESIYRFGEDVTVERDEIVQGDVVVLGADVFVDGEVDGNVYVVVGDLFVEGDGSIANDAVSLGGRVRVDDDSVVHGRRIAPNLAAPGVLPGIWSASGGLAWIMHWSRVAVLALLVVIGFHVAEDRMRRLVRHGDSAPARDLLSGALWFSVLLGVFVVASVGLVISVIGIPVVIVLVAGFGIAAILAYAVGCHVIGDRLLDRFGETDAQRTWQSALLGLAILEIPALVALALSTGDTASPAMLGLRGVEFLLKFSAISIGVGAIVATRGGLENDKKTETTTGQPELALPSGGDDGRSA